MRKTIIGSVTALLISFSYLHTARAANPYAVTYERDGSSERVFQRKAGKYLCSGHE
jgi:hypothetical protein